MNNKLTLIIRQLEERSFNGRSREEDVILELATYVKNLELRLIKVERAISPNG